MAALHTSTGVADAMATSATGANERAIRWDPGPFRVAVGSAAIVVAGPRALPFVIVAASHRPNPPNSDDDEPPAAPPPPPPASAAGETKEGADGAEESGGSGAAPNASPPAGAAPPPEKPARPDVNDLPCFQGLQEPIASRAHPRGNQRTALLPCVGCGTWDVAIACPALLLDDVDPGPYVSHVRHLRHLLSDVPPEGSADPDALEAAARQACTLDVDAVRARVPEEWALFIVAPEVPKGPFIGETASAAAISGTHLPLFRQHSLFFDLVFSWCPMEWAFLRAGARGLSPEQWAFFWRRAQTMFPKTERERSLAVHPPLLVSPNPYRRFCIDLRSAATADGALEWSNFTYHGYLLQGREADGAKRPDATAAEQRDSGADASDAGAPASSGVGSEATASAGSPLGSNARRKWRKDVAAREAALGAVRLTLNRDFRGTLHAMRAYHMEQRASTWFDPDYVEVLAAMAESDSLNDGVPAALQAAVVALGPDVALGTAASPSEGWEGLDSMVRRCAAYGPKKDGEGPPRVPPEPPLDFAAVAADDETVLGERADVREQALLAARRVELCAFELWDAATDELLASTFGFRVGRAFHDCSMSTFKRNRAGYGHLLSHAVADVLQRSGVELWYWGAELPYMTSYRATARAFDVLNRDFFQLWRRVAAKAPPADIHDVIAHLPGTAAMPPRAQRPPPPGPPLRSVEHVVHDDGTEEEIVTETPAEVPAPRVVIVAGAPAAALLPDAED